MNVWKDLMTVRVVSIKLMPEHPHIKALADVQVGPFALHGCSVMEKEIASKYGNGKRKVLVAYPPRVLGREGKWRPAARIEEPQLFLEFRQAILDAYDEIANSQEQSWDCRKCGAKNETGSYKCHSCSVWKNGTESEAYADAVDSGLNEAGKHFRNK